MLRNRVGILTTEFMDYGKFSQLVYSNSNKSVVASLETKTRTHLFYTENLSLYLARLFSDLKNKKHSNTDLTKDRNKLRLVILETSPGFGGDERWDLHYWWEYYKSKGYSFYGSQPPITVLPIITVTTRGVLVQLRNKAYNRFTIGVFGTLEEAQEWLDIFYNEDNSIVPVWACNKETIDYFDHTK